MRSAYEKLLKTCLRAQKLKIMKAAIELFMKDDVVVNFLNTTTQNAVRAAKICQNLGLDWDWDNSIKLVVFTLGRNRFAFEFSQASDAIILMKVGIEQIGVVLRYGITKDEFTEAIPLLSNSDENIKIGLLTLV